MMLELFSVDLLPFLLIHLKSNYQEFTNHSEWGAREQKTLAEDPLYFE